MIVVIVRSFTLDMFKVIMTFYERVSNYSYIHPRLLFRPVCKSENLRRLLVDKFGPLNRINILVSELSNKQP